MWVCRHPSSTPAAPRKRAAGGRARLMRWRWGLAAKDVRVVPEAECRFSFYDMPGSQKACGFDYRDESVPVPVFPIPNASYVAAGLRAADESFAMLRAAMESGALKLE